jgi:hypothetical protein
VKPRLPLLAAVLALAVVAFVALAPGAGAMHPGSAARHGDGWRPGPDPCKGPGAKHLLCPDLRIGTPSDLYLSTYEGRTLLHATSDVRSRGAGPMELHGQRDGPKRMKVVQWIYRKGGGHLAVRTDATLRFTDVGEYFGGSYWKVHQLARFTLRKVRRGGGTGPVVRTSPKLNYCLRDLDRTAPGPTSPPNRVYPACNQNPSIKRDRLGTSVGWSDIYPADYDKQYIDVTGLRGCFVFEMTVDPNNLLFESSDRDNSSRRRVRLPFDGRGC